MRSSLYPASAGIVACVIWGLSVFFYKSIKGIAPSEILAHRAFWSMVFFLIILSFQKKHKVIISNILNWQRLKFYCLATILISVNWFGFIYSIKVDKVTQASFGYFIFPIVAVCLGYLFNRERFSTLQIISICLASISVLILGAGLGEFPYLSLLLATTFGFYGLLKGYVSDNPIVSVATETTLAAPFAIGYILLLRLSNFSSDFLLGYNSSQFLLLITSGFLTALPLVLFAFAAQSLRYSTVGLINYVNPTLQFFIAVFILSESFGYLNLIAFVLIWVGLAFYSYETIRLDSFKNNRVS